MSISVQWMLAIEARPSDRNVSAQAYPFSTGSGATPKEVKNTGCLRIQYPLLPQPAHVLLPFYLFNCQITTMNIHPCLHNSVTQSWPHEPQHVRPPCPSPMAWSLPKPMSTESVMPSNHLILCHPLFLLPLIFPSIRVFSNESVLPIRCSKYWSFSISINPFNEYSGLISFRMDWLYLLAVQGTLKSLLQHHSSKASVLPCLAFFIVQLSYLYMITGKTIALTRQTFTDKVMSLLFNMLSRLVIAFLPRSKRLLISWLQSPSAVILEPPQNKKSVTVSTVSPSIYHEVMGHVAI